MKSINREESKGYNFKNFSFYLYKIIYKDFLKDKNIMFNKNRLDIYL